MFQITITFSVVRRFVFFYQIMAFVELIGKFAQATFFPSSHEQ